MGAAPVEDQPLKRTGERRSRLNFDLQFHHRVPLVRPDDLQLRGLGTSNEPRLEGRALNKLVSSQSAHFFLMRAQQLKRTTQPLPPVSVQNSGGPGSTVSRWVTSSRPRGSAPLKVPSRFCWVGCAGSANTCTSRSASS